MATFQQRAALCIDGFNAYNGIRAAGLDDCRWLDWRSLGDAVCGTDGGLSIYYFSALVNVPVEGRRRQERYLRALEVHTGIVPVLGSFMSRPMKCPDCGFRWKRPKEQYTDVNIALTIQRIALLGEADRIFLLSGDSDLVPAVHVAREHGIDVVNIIPPKRKSDDLVAACDDVLHLDEILLRRCSLPNPVVETYKGGRKQRPLEAPEGWTSEGNIAPDGG